MEGESFEVIGDSIMGVGCLSVKPAVSGNARARTRSKKSGSDVVLRRRVLRAVNGSDISGDNGGDCAESCCDSALGLAGGDDSCDGDVWVSDGLSRLESFDADIVLGNAPSASSLRLLSTTNNGESNFDSGGFDRYRPLRARERFLPLLLCGIG